MQTEPKVTCLDRIGSDRSGVGRHQLVGGLPNVVAAAATHSLVLPEGVAVGAATTPDGVHE